MLVLQNDTSNHNFDEKIEETVDFLLKKFQKTSEVAIVITDKNNIQEFNKTYRNKNTPTNVLSFPSGVPSEIANILGDIIICFEVLEEEAKQQHKTFKHHLIHIIIHGFLHLLGYDHIQENDATKMEQIEVELLQELGIDNPY